MGGLSEERVAAGRAIIGSVEGLTTECVAPVRSIRSVGVVSERRVAPVPAIEIAERDIICGNSSAVERQPSKLGVAGSNPVSRSMVTSAACPGGPKVAWSEERVAPDIERAHVAQSAERVLGKDEVSGSNPDMGSRLRTAAIASGERR